MIKKPQVVWLPAVFINKESTDTSPQSSQENFAKCATDVKTLSYFQAPTMRNTFSCREAFFVWKFTSRRQDGLAVYGDGIKKEKEKLHPLSSPSLLASSFVVELHALRKKPGNFDLSL